MSASAQTRRSAKGTAAKESAITVSACVEVAKAERAMDLRGGRLRRRHREAERAMELRSVRRFGYARTIDEDEWTYAACGDRLSPHWAKRNESERMDLRGKRSATPCMVLARMKGVRGRGRGLRRK